MATISMYDMDVGLSPRVRGSQSVLGAMDGTRRSIPRVRGSRSRFRFVFGCERSIPACAGEPHAREMRPQSYEVYPRVCGGAVLIRVEALACQGLSPRVRGSR